MPKVFEFHFNPRSHRGFGGQAKLKPEDAIFDTFCFVPETRAESALGNLYLVGELKNVLPKTKELLPSIAEVIQREYYRFPQKEAQDCFKEGLQKANEFLARELKKENTAWLGNLNFVTLSLTPDFLLNLSKVGNLKTLLLKGEEVFDIGENINVAFSPGKIFPNLIEGKVREGDKILILSEEVFRSFWRERIFQNLKEIKKPKELKKIFKEKKKILRELFGVCLFVFVKEERRKIFLKLPRIPVSSFLSKISQKFFPHSPLLQEKLKRSLISLLILAFLLLLGYLVFK